jgi:hypothetical protein
MTPLEMRQRAQQYRKMALVIDDSLAQTALIELAGHYEAQAKAAEADKSRYGEDGGGSR